MVKCKVEYEFLVLGEKNEYVKQIDLVNNNKIFMSKQNSGCTDYKLLIFNLFGLVVKQKFFSFKLKGYIRDF